MKVIVTKYDGNCADCGAFLPAGTRVKWYGRGRIYGFDCHARPAARNRDTEPIGQTLSRYDRYGVYTADGRRIGSTCGCEDYPCCGH